MEVLASAHLQSESKLWREQERLERDREFLTQQMESHEVEKQKYMEAARRLDREVHVPGAYVASFSGFITTHVTHILGREGGP